MGGDPTSEETPSIALSIAFWVTLSLLLERIVSDYDSIPHVITRIRTANLRAFTIIIMSQRYRIQFKMHSITVWKLAKSPNYDTHINKLYPYSELPYLGEYKLLKIPISLNNLIDHVDYWGEGRIVTEHGISGFTNCYNVNHPYQLVSNGSDRDKKIPNRIPVLSYTNCDTSAYIKDSSVCLVTVMGSPINSSCAKDIGRMINEDLGRVIIFGFDPDSQYVTNLKQELEKKELYLCPGFELPDELKGLTLFEADNYRAFLNVSDFKNELYKKITSGAYSTAVNISKNLANSQNGGHILSALVIKLLNENCNNLIIFGYKLWQDGAKDIVRNYFPAEFKLIFNEDPITIVNDGYYQALKLDVNKDYYNDRLAWGDANDKTSKRVSWKLIPIRENNKVVFKIYNIDCNMYLKLDVNSDGIGDRKAWGSTNSNDVRHKYELEIVFKYNKLLFLIINYEYKQALKLAVETDRYGDRLLWGHNEHNDGNFREQGRFHWAFKAW